MLGSISSRLRKSSLMLHVGTKTKVMLVEGVFSHTISKKKLTRHILTGQVEINVFAIMMEFTPWTLPQMLVSKLK